MEIKNAKLLTDKFELIGFLFSFSNDMNLFLFPKFYTEVNNSVIYSRLEVPLKKNT